MRRCLVIAGTAILGILSFAGLLGDQGLLLPSILLFIPLLFFRYPGERQISAIARAVRARTRRRAPRGQSNSPRPSCLRLSSIAECGLSLSIRPPPA